MPICILTDSPIDTNKLVVDLKREEGFRSKPYQDTTGHWTIGYGRNISTVGITESEASFLLSNDIDRAISEAEAQPWWPMVKDCEPRCRAFVELTFNIGIRALAGFSKALDAAMRSDWIACGAEFRNSLWFRQVGNRAEKICSMIEKGEDYEPGQGAV